MKKTIIFLGFVLLSFTPEKEYKLKFKESQVQMLWNVLEFSKTSMQTSQSSALDVRQATQAIDSIEKVIRSQYIIQSTDTSKKK